MPIDAKFTTSVAVLRQLIDHARIYIRPIQTDLPLQEEDADKEENVGQRDCTMKRRDGWQLLLLCNLHSLQCKS